MLLFQEDYVAELQDKLKRLKGKLFQEKVKCVCVCGGGGVQACEHESVCVCGGGGGGGVQT